ncbi:MAG: hypothetical protein WBP61_01825 [Nocardioides sp.]
MARFPHPVLAAVLLAAAVAVPVAATASSHDDAGPGGRAAAATASTLGQVTNGGIRCDESGAHPTIIQSTWAAGGTDYTAHAPGVITSFSTYQSDTSARGLVLRPTGAANQYTVVGRSAVGQASGPAIVAVATRITVQPGDRIALQVLSPAGTKSWCYVATPSGFAASTLPAADFNPETDGAVADFTGAPSESQFAVNLAAQLEPDADGDGYGDVTQDLCPTLATQQTPCPAEPTEEPTTPTPTPTPSPTTTPTPAAPRPDTTLVGTTKKKTSKRAVTLRFRSSVRGSTFRCQIDKRRVTRCASPFRSRYKPGKHVVTVTAVDPSTGLSDRTPLVVKFKVKLK